MAIEESEKKKTMTKDIGKSVQQEEDINAEFEEDNAEAKAADREALTATAAKKKKKKKKGVAKEEEMVENKKPSKHVRKILEELARRREEEERRREEEERARREEEERARLEEERERIAEEKRRIKKEREKEKKKKKRQEGKLLTPKQRENQKRLESMRMQFLQPKSKVDDNEEECDDVDVTLENNASKHEEANSSEKSGKDLRSPICCILGHVDAGKTKLLDCIRGTNIQRREAGGITQQIGATYFPAENIRERTRELKDNATFKVPGLLVIDTPGHGHFSNLRSKGSSMCDIAVLVVDIVHGLEEQTIQSLELLKSRNIKFIVALNKVDKIYGWKCCPNAPIIKAIKQQSKEVKRLFDLRITEIVREFQARGLNTALYYRNREMVDTVSMIPTSAISGEGIPDLLLLLVLWAQRTMEDELTSVDKVQCNVLEVKEIEGLGTTIDVVLVNGSLHVGDRIVVCGMQGPIITTIKALLTPPPMNELRIIGRYEHHKEVKAAQGIKISAHHLEHAIAGTAMYVVGPYDDLEDVKETVMQDMNRMTSQTNKSGVGVYLQASTLGSLEVLIELLRSPDTSIPFSDFSIGPVHKNDVVKAGAMLDKKEEYAAILAFDVNIVPAAQRYANEIGVRIFTADTIYRLPKQFKAYITEFRGKMKKENAQDVVFPCILKILRSFNRKNPIILGVKVHEGTLKVGTPLCIPPRVLNQTGIEPVKIDCIDIGRVESIEIDHRKVEEAKKGQEVAVKITGSGEEQEKLFGRHIDIKDELVSHISRRSIDILKEYYRKDLSREDWNLVKTLKEKVFKIL